MMRRSRKYLDRGRRLELHGQPLEPDWPALLHMGHRVVETGRAGTAPYLADVMGAGIAPQRISPRPVAFDNPLLRRWLAVEPEVVLTFVRDELGNLRAPDSAREMLEMLERPDCLETGMGHRLRHARAQYGDTWAVGWCNDCTRALLWRFDEDSFSTWPFYNHDA